MPFFHFECIGCIAGEMPTAQRIHDRLFVDAVLWIFANAKIVAEPSGAAATAAVLTGLLDETLPPGGPVVAIVSGGNMSFETLQELERRAGGL